MKNFLLALVMLPILSCGKTKDDAQSTATESSSYSTADSTVTTTKETDTTSMTKTTIDNTTTIENDKIVSTTVTKTENPSSSTIETETEVAAINHSNWTTLLQKNVSRAGIVNYKGFQKDSKALSAYLAELSANVPTKSTSRNATLAYWINTYNAYTVKLIIDNYPTNSIKDINDPWGKKFITLSGKKYSLEGIENEILRKMDEPRIHFAINCASVSCPNLLNEAFTEAKLEQQLKAVSKSFINDKTKNTITANKIEVSKIFDWFGADFKSKGSVIDFLNQYSTTKISTNAQVNFKEYNWGLNE
jgi:hypothetical protein